MEDRTDLQAQINQLAVLACEFSGVDAFHVREGRQMFLHSEAQARARVALDILAGVGRPTIL